MRRNERKLLILEALTNYSAPVSAGTLWAKHFKNGPYRTSWDAIRKRLEGYTVWNLVERTRSRVHPYEWYYKPHRAIIGSCSASYLVGVH